MVDSINKKSYRDNKVWINNTQYFSGITAAAWDFFIGGFQPAQKWLKDRMGHVLTFDDVRHYQRIIKVLVETDRIMNEIDLKFKK
ncbi:adenine specific DNA methyltransferase [Pseudomonas aeruginosa PA103]|nr:putative adenine specific DNA methyltransferase [Pseudomonas aeruginosa]EYU08537.1 adenine specific DNA methyltransferase [Pseudomonas aeruginosa PA103]